MGEAICTPDRKRVNHLKLQKDAGRGNMQPSETDSQTKRRDMAGASQLAMPALWLGLIVAAAVFTSVFWAYAHENRLWVDEIYTLWVTDTAHSVVDMQNGVLRVETNPPLHYWLMYFMRLLISDSISAGRGLNMLCAVITTALIVWLPRRACKPGLGLTLGLVFLLSAGATCLVQDIRPALVALCLCISAAALAGTVRLKGTADRLDLGLAAGLGLLGGISHVYGALFIGALAASMVIDGVATGKRKQWAFALVLGLSCCLSFGLWWTGLMLTTHGHLATIEWLKDPDLNKYTLPLAWPAYFGPDYVWVLFAGGLALALSTRAFRQALSAWLVCAVIFAALPVIISLKMPIILWRYLVIASPAFHILLVFVWLDTASRLAHPLKPWAAAALAGAALTVIAPVLSGIYVGRLLVAERPDWTGIDVVRAQAAQCPSATIRIATPDGTEASQSPAYLFGYQFLTRGSGLRLEDASQTHRDVADINCSVVGWTEHVLPVGIIPGVPDEAEALQRLNLTNKKGVPLIIERHRFGFVVSKARAG
jgi:hypothetical protein